MWTEEAIHEVVEKQRTYFRSGETLDVSWRIRQLKRLRTAVRIYEEDLVAGLREDLGRSEAEAYIADIGSLIMEIDETIAGLRRWAKPELHLSGPACFPSLFTRVYKMPYGVSLIISPFNFPLLLSLGPLTAAIAGGNTAVIKASSKSPAVTRALQKVIKETFPEEYICVVDGGHDVADLCRFVVSDGVAGRELQAAAPYDLVVANILAGPLVELAPSFAASVKPGGRVLLSGLLVEQAAQILAAYGRCGFAFERRIDLETGGAWWRTLVLRRS